MVAWATLGETEIEVLTGPSSFDTKYAANYAELPLMNSKSGLQFTGFSPDESNWTIKLHATYCNPADEARKLKEHMDAQDTLALVMGTGEYRGVFVITGLDVALEFTDGGGNIIAMELAVSLKEYIGDPAKPNPPGVITYTLPIEAIANPEIPLPLSVEGFLETVATARAVIETVGEASARVQDIVATVESGDILGAVGLAGEFAPQLAEMATFLPADKMLALKEVAMVAHDAGEVAEGLSVTQSYLNEASAFLEDPSLSGLSSASSRISSAVESSAGTKPALDRLQAHGATGSRLSGVSK